MEQGIPAGQVEGASTIQQEAMPGDSSERRPHHGYGMSKLNYWRDCAGFTNKEEASQRALQAAEEGEDLHNLMDDIVHRSVDLLNSGGWKQPGDALLEAYRKIIGENPTLDDDDQYYLKYCVDQLVPIFNRGPSHIMTEERANTYNPDKSILNYGYYDLLVIFGDYEWSVLVDYKFGWIKVPAAADNEQGRGYGLSVLQDYPSMRAVIPMFIQPKLQFTTKCKLTRDDVQEVYDDISGIIAERKQVEETWGESGVVARLSPGPYCKWCEHQSVDCPALTREATLGVARVTNMKLPSSFNPDDIKTPEDAAIAVYLVSVLEDAVSPIRKRALEIARNMGGAIEFEAHDGSKIRYETAARRHSRSVKDVPMTVQELSQYIAPEQLIAAAGRLDLGALEESTVSAMVEIAKAEGRKLTKKRAREEFYSLMEVNDLVSRADGSVEYLKMVREKKPRKRLPTAKKPKPKTKSSK